MARFGTHTVGSQVLVLPKDLKFTPAPVAGQLHRPTRVGEAEQNPRSSRAAFAAMKNFCAARRSTSPACCPPSAEYQSFMADSSPDKRAKLVDRLLARKEFSEIWAMKWAELLMIKSSNDVSYKAMLLYSTWLTDKIANNVPLDEMVRELLSANGGTFQEPGHELLSDRTRYAQDGRKRGPAVHGHPHPMLPVPQPSVRPLDDERLLQLRGLLCSGGPQAGRRLSRDDHLQQRRRRSDASRGRASDGPQILGRTGGRRGRQGSPRGLADWLTSPGESLFRHQRGQPRVGALLRHAGSSNRSTIFA